MAARSDPRRVSAHHQSMHHFVANAPWDDRAVIEIARDDVLAQMERHGAVQAWVIDDTGIPKKGTHSVGIARQYCEVLGKQDHCQVAVTVSLVSPVLSVPCAYRLYLPEAWAQRPATRGGDPSCDPLSHEVGDRPGRRRSARRPGTGSPRSRPPSPRSTSCV